jgi:hypothetical protein
MTGKIIDQVDTMCFLPPVVSEIPMWYHQCEQLLNWSVYPYPTGESLQHVWWRMMICDLYGTSLGRPHDRAVEGFEPLYLSETISHEAWLLDSLNDESSSERNEYQKLMQRTSYIMNFCITKKRLAGYLQQGSQEADVICIFAGSTVPHIIRKLPNGYYQLIGEAYIHGIMDGEAMDWEGIEWKDIGLV